MVTRKGTYQRTWDKAAATALGFLRPPGAVLWFNSLWGTGEPEANTITCEKATMATT